MKLDYEKMKCFEKYRRLENSDRLPLSNTKYINIKCESPQKSFRVFDNQFYISQLVPLTIATEVFEPPEFDKYLGVSSSLN